MPQLRLVPMAADAEPVGQMLMTEKTAAKYLGVNRLRFREWVFQGLLPTACLPGMKRRVYWRKDLDSFIASLDWHTMPAREDPPQPVRGGRL